MSDLIKLTRWDGETRDEPVFIKPSAITSLVRLEAYKCETTGSEGGARTRVTLGPSGIVLVQELPESIYYTIEEQECKP